MNEDRLDIVKRAISGNKEALVELIKQEQGNIYTTLFYLKKNDNDLSDIMQDVLIKLSTKIKQLKNPVYFKTWLNQIIINSYYDYLRKSKRKPVSLELDKISNETGLEISDNTQNPQDRVLKSEMDFVIKNSIQNLPLHYKIPIALREIQGLSYFEISNITKTSLGPVKSRIARARALIKEDINKYSQG